MILIFVLTLLLNIFQDHSSSKDCFWPVTLPERSEIQLTAIGGFAVQRSARPGIPAHLHTGIDIKRPTDNFTNELIYPVARGVVISKRDDGPFAQLIIKHTLDQLTFWTLYEHIAGIMVSVGDSLYPRIPLARFMNREELNRYGWQFNHFHFEILKTAPDAQKNDSDHPERFFKSRTLTVYSKKDLQKHFYNPTHFINSFRQIKMELRITNDAN